MSIDSEPELTKAIQHQIKLRGLDETDARSMRQMIRHLQDEQFNMDVHEALEGILADKKWALQIKEAEYKREAG